MSKKRTFRIVFLDGTREDVVCDRLSWGAAGCHLIDFVGCEVPGIACVPIGAVKYITELESQ